MTKSQHIRASKKIWTKSDDSFLKKHYHYGAKLCAVCLNVNINTVYHRAYALGIPGIKGEKYTNEQIEFIKNNYATMSHTEIGAIIGRSKWSVKAFASSHGLKRKEMKPIYLQMPELLDLKRNELQLRRTINELTETSKTN